MEHYVEIGRMTFEQFETFMRLHGGRSWKYKQTIGDSQIDFMDGVTQFVSYRCDNVRLWCKVRAQ